ncbi:MAG: hypothetical protein WKF34_14145 [Pyrinomonadaceae bacterium]
MKRDWQLTESALNGLLATLDVDPGLAGKEYERLRIRLIRLFEWRGAETPEDLADETLNRTARKIEEGLKIESISNFVGGVARNVLREFYAGRERERKNNADLAHHMDDVPTDEVDGRVPCFRECLDDLAEEQSQLLIDYYNWTDMPKIRHRQELAARAGETANALRIRVHRIRQELDKCIQHCLAKG